MKMLLTLLVAALIPFLGGGVEGLVSVPAAPRRIKVACIGDSIVSGYALADPAQDAYPSQLQRLLDRDAPGRYEVRNFGDPGRGVYMDTPAFDGKGLRGYRHWQVYRASLAWEPDIVVSNFGINDIVHYPEEALGTREKGRFVREYRELLEAYRALPSRPKLLVWTRLAPLTSRHRLFGSSAPVDMRPDLDAVARALGAQAVDMSAPFTKTDGYFQRDGVHPNPWGAAVIAETVRKALLGDAAGGVR